MKRLKQRYEWAIDYHDRWGRSFTRTGIMRRVKDETAIEVLKRMCRLLRCKHFTIDLAELKRYVPFVQAYWTAVMDPSVPASRRWQIEVIKPGYRFVDGMFQRQPTMPEPPAPPPEIVRPVRVRDLKFGLIRDARIEHADD